MLNKIRENTVHLKYGREALVLLAVKALAKTNCPKVLDLGVSRGNDLVNVRKALNRDCELYGVEFLPESIEYCKKIGIEASATDLEYEVLPYDDSSFDLVISNQTYEHLKNIFWCTSEVCRILKPGGYFLIGVPNLASPHCSLPLLFCKQPRQIKTHGPHIRGYTISGVKDLLLTDGYFEFSSMMGSGFYPFPLKIAKFMSELLPCYSTSIFCLFRRTDREESFIENFKANYFYETSYFVG